MDAIADICGRNKGIQGENISSYVDTLLFACFAFSSTLQREINARRGLNEQQEAAKKWLTHKIIFPLRKKYFVSSNHVLKFRQLLVAITGDENYVGQRRDILECFDDLMLKVFQIDSLINVR